MIEVPQIQCNSIALDLGINYTNGSSMMILNPQTGRDIRLTFSNICFNIIEQMFYRIVLAISTVLYIMKEETIKKGKLNYERNANSFWMAYDSGRYADSIKDRYENIYNDVVTTAELKQCYAVSEYFEAASLYKAAVVTGKTDKAQEYLAVMEEALEEMGDVEYLAEDINQKLGIADTAK